MNSQFWIETIVSFVAGIAVVIPLVIELVKQITKAVEEKNWNIVVKNMLNFMVEAEYMFERGADKKEYVMMAIENTAQSINYNYNNEAKQKVSDMIDAICEAAKGINA